MKKLTRVFSIVISLVLMLSVAVMPTTAASVPTDAHVTFELEVKPVIGELDNKGAKSEDNGIYKAIVYLTSDVRLSSVLMDVTYDNTKFLPIMGAASGAKMWTRTATKGKLIASNRAGTMLDDKAYYADGSVETDPDSAAFADYWGPSNSEVSAAYAFKFEYLKDGAASWTYEPADKTLEIGECTHEPVAEIYFKLIDGQSADGAVFGFGTGEGTSTKSIGFDSTPAEGKYFTMMGSNGVNIHPVTLVSTPSYTYTAAAKSIIQPMSSQIRFKNVKTEDDFKAYNALEDGNADKTFDVRSRATIAKDDFNAKFTDEATAKAKISEFGFIYRANTSTDPNYAAFNIDTAKGVADGSIADATYVKKKCTYLQRTADGYNFTCLISPIKDTAESRADGVTCLAYVCFDGEYIFFDKEVVVDYTTLYAVNPGTTA